MVQQNLKKNYYLNKMDSNHNQSLNQLMLIMILEHLCKRLNLRIICNFQLIKPLDIINLVMRLQQWLNTTTLIWKILTNPQTFHWLTVNRISLPLNKSIIVYIISDISVQNQELLLIQPQMLYKMVVTPYHIEVGVSKTSLETSSLNIWRKNNLRQAKLILCHLSKMLSLLRIIEIITI